MRKTRACLAAALLASAAAVAGCGGNAGKGAAIGAAGGAGLGAVGPGSILGNAATGAVVGGASGFIYDQLKGNGRRRRQRSRPEPERRRLSRRRPSAAPRDGRPADAVQLCLGPAVQGGRRWRRSPSRRRQPTQAPLKRTEVRVEPIRRVFVRVMPRAASRSGSSRAIAKSLLYLSYLKYLW